MIRKMTAADINSVVCIERSTLHKTMGEEYYLNTSTDFNFVYELNGCVVGVITSLVIYEVAEILTFCVDFNWQNRGFGKEILNFYLNQLPSSVAKVHLEVRLSNLKAKAIYESFGFKQIYIRKNYYEDGEDALIMQLDIIR